MESNHRPAVYETAALPTELRRLSGGYTSPANQKRDLTQDVKHLSMQDAISREISLIVRLGPDPLNEVW